MWGHRVWLCVCNQGIVCSHKRADAVATTPVPVTSARGIIIIMCIYRWFVHCCVALQGARTDGWGGSGERDWIVDQDHHGCCLST